MSLRPHIFVVDIAKDIYKKGYIKRLEERERHVMLWDNFIWKIGSKHPTYMSNIIYIHIMSIGRDGGNFNTRLTSASHARNFPTEDYSLNL